MSLSIHAIIRLHVSKEGYDRPSFLSKLREKRKIHELVRKVDEVEDEQRERGDKRIFSEAGMFIDAIFARPHRRVVCTRWREFV